MILYSRDWGIMRSSLLLDKSIPFRVTDEIHSFLCSYTTYSILNECMKSECNNEKNWQQTVERGDVLVLVMICGLGGLIIL